jgi:hypothetical protein
MPWQELEETYAPQFSSNVGAPAKPVRLAFESLYIKQRLDLMDEETIIHMYLPLNPVLPWICRVNQKGFA